jgi:hypothetical protein
MFSVRRGARARDVHLVATRTARCGNGCIEHEAATVSLGICIHYVCMCVRVYIYIYIYIYIGIGIGIGIGIYRYIGIHVTYNSNALAAD